MEVREAPLSASPYTNALVQGPAWAGLTLTFSFPTSSALFTGYTGGEPSSNFEPLNAVQQDAVRTIFAMLSSFTNLTFTEITGANAGSAVLRFGMTDATATAHAYLPSPSELGGDSWYRNSGGTYDNPVLGSYAWDTLLHEIGHALGLGHPHEASPPMPGDRDWMPYTVMSYRSSAHAADELGYYNEEWSFPQSFMIEDIAALQFLYGANYGYRAGDTVYSWDTNTGQMFVDGVGQGLPGGNRVFMTVWDGGGIDTYDFSNHASYHPGVIDLRPGAFTRFSAGQQASLGGGGTPPGNIANALLFNGNPQSLIENAIGTGVDDTIYGNDLANVLSGGGGRDTIHGLLGNDTLHGGAEWDFLHGEDGDDALHGGDEHDNLYGGIGGDSLHGDGGDDSLEGEAGDDWLFGGLGGDYLSGGADHDRLDGGDGEDRLKGDDGDDVLSDVEGSNSLEGGAGADVLTAGAGDDWLVGGTGADLMTGGPGNDTYSVDDLGDRIVELDGQGIDTLETVFETTALAGVFENLRLLGTAVVGTGNSLDNALSGNTVGNVLRGGDGADTVDGWEGNDRLYGDAGADTLSGQLGDDVIDGGSGADRMFGQGGNDTYYVDDPGDLVRDLENGGNDTVYSSVSYVLESTPPIPPGYDPYAGASVRWPDKYAVETLVLTGLANLDGTGSEIANTLRGNSGNNRLDGKEGNDTLVGGGGADQLIGGSGADVFVYAAVTDSPAGSEDWLSDFEHGIDRIDMRQIATTGVSFEVAGDNGSTRVVVNTDAGTALVLRVAGVANASDFLFSSSTPSPPAVTIEPSGAFATPFQWMPRVPPARQPWYVGDFDGNGKDDVFRYVEGASGADVFLSVGTRFSGAGSWTGAGVGADGKWHVGDFNGDGRDDVFRYLPGTSGADMFLSSGAGFVHSGSWTGAGYGIGNTWFIGDFNGDGRDDVFRYLPGTSGADMFLSDGSRFAPDGSWTGAGYGIDGKWYLGDFNGDGKDDIFRYLPGTSGADMFLSNGDRFVHAGSWTGAGYGVDNTWHVGDFDGDGKDDIFRYLPGSSGADVFLSTGTAFVHDGSWSAAGPGSSGWYIGDFTGDGSWDLLRITATGSDVLI